MKRTAAAINIGQHKYIECVMTLCAAVEVEKALYSKIAISNALVNMGEVAIIPLINLLGVIGTNQHKKLPAKPFNKKSYPLPRDIAARALVRMGYSVLNELELIFKIGRITQVSEAIDVYGHICFNSEKTRSPSSLLECYIKYNQNDVVIWKLLRAFSAFGGHEVCSILENTIMNSKINQHVWESKSGSVRKIV